MNTARRWRYRGFFLGAVDESTRIDDDDVRVFFLIGYRITLARQGSEHDFAIYQILGTAEADEPHLRRFVFRHP